MMECFSNYQFVRFVLQELQKVEKEEIQRKRKKDKKKNWRKVLKYGFRRTQSSYECIQTLLIIITVKVN